MAVCRRCNKEIRVGECYLVDGGGHEHTGCQQGTCQETNKFYHHRFGQAITADYYICINCHVGIPAEVYDAKFMVQGCVIPTVDNGLLKDTVNHPSHYTQGGIECIDALAAATTNLKGIEAVATANAIKYLWRWKEKNGITDLKKAAWYINYLIQRQEVKE